MKVVFISNYFNHHQAPFSEAMNRLTDGHYCFVATEAMSEERINMGWGGEELPNYVIKLYESVENQNYAKRKIKDADVVIFGLSGWKNFKLIKERLSQGKLTFRYSERIYKESLKCYRFPIQAVKLWLVGGRYDSMHMLCASAYAAQDYARTNSYLGKTFKWGYFPTVKQYDVYKLMQEKSSASLMHPQVSILWAGRLIGWKHPDASIELAASLKKKGYSFKMSIIGNGEMETQLREMIRDKGVEDCVEMLGAMSPDDVRGHMEKADIYLFTSDFNEGWGAVLNESMNSGCAVVASHAIGSVPFLIKNGENGLIYENGNQTDFEKQVQRLLDDADYRGNLGINAYQTVASMWNADVAAERLIKLCEELLLGNDATSLFSEGPCSKAERITNDWFHE